MGVGLHGERALRLRNHTFNIVRRIASRRALGSGCTAKAPWASSTKSVQCAKMSEDAGVAGTEAALPPRAGVAGAVGAAAARGRP